MAQVVVQQRRGDQAHQADAFAWYQPVTNQADARELVEHEYRPHHDQEAGDDLQRKQEVSSGARRRTVLGVRDVHPHQASSPGGARRCSRGAAIAARVRAHISVTASSIGPLPGWIGGCMTSLAQPGRMRQDPGARSSRVPTTVIGNTGRFRSTATLKAPLRNLINSPLRLRVPSGKNSTPVPGGNRPTALLMAALAWSGLPRSMKICPIARQPWAINGNFPISAFMTQRRSRPQKPQISGISNWLW